MRNALIMVVLTGAVVGWMAPNLSTVEEPVAAHRAADTATDAKIANVSTGNGGWAAGALTLPRESDGHFYADINVEMRPYRMLVDTGASVVALTANDARDMGLHWSPTDVRIVGHGASGEVHGVPTIIPQMQLGEFNAENVPAVIIPEGLAISLLGQSFLKRIGSVTIEGDAMVLDN